MEENTKTKTEPFEYDEELEGFYILTAPALNMRSIPGGKKPNTVVCAVMNGSTLRCEGKFVDKDGERYLFVFGDTDKGYIPLKHLRKL